MLYPLKFRPRLKERIWGGTKLLAKKHTRVDKSKLYGESWDISCVKRDLSVVSNGLLKGNNLQELIEVYMGDLVGDKIFEKFGLEFPLLIKTLDCNDVLSVQVHPDDELAEERHNSFGKTEMWYVTACEPGASIYIGFSDPEITREKYLDAVSGGYLPQLLNKVEVKAGDAFFIPAGMVHALGKGVEVVEIQQTSDITYRIYDWDRTDAEGNPRELHTALAVDAIDFSRSPEECIIKCSAASNKTVKVAECKYFTTNLIAVDGTVGKEFVELDSFVIYCCIGGEVLLETESGSETLKEGDTVLVPAETNEVTLKGQGRLLEVYIA